jgi:tRNA(Ile)-lysidine synthase
MPALRSLRSSASLNLMRHWFGLRGMRMPSAAWMQEMRSQLLQADVEAQLCVSHPDGEVHRYRERVFLTPRRTPPDEATVIRLRWKGRRNCALIPTMASYISSCWRPTIHGPAFAAVAA